MSAEFTRGSFKSHICVLGDRAITTVELNANYNFIDVIVGNASLRQNFCRKYARHSCCWVHAPPLKFNVKIETEGFSSTLTGVCASHFLSAYITKQYKCKWPWFNEINRQESNDELIAMLFYVVVYSSFFVKISRLVCYITKVSFLFLVSTQYMCCMVGWGEPPNILYHFLASTPATRWRWWNKVKSDVALELNYVTVFRVSDFEQGRKTRRKRLFLPIVYFFPNDFYLSFNKSINMSVGWRLPFSCLTYLLNQLTSISLCPLR